MVRRSLGTPRSKRASSERTPFRHAKESTPSRASSSPSRSNPTIASGRTGFARRLAPALNARRPRNESPLPGFGARRTTSWPRASIARLSTEIPTKVPLPPVTSAGVPVTKRRRATGLVYTGALGDLEAIRAYYARILPFYEREVAARGDLPFWEELARLWRPSRILEIGCGNGRVTGALSRTAPAVGIDISFDLLERARKSPGRRKARFVAADFRCPIFRAGFDLIVAPSDPLSHVTGASDRRSALRAVAGQLAP